MSWATDRVHQDLSATGSYNANSDLAKEYAGLAEDGSSRVDDGEGWREIKKDSPPKNAAEYAQLVKDYAAQGFDVKAIDMDGNDFTNSNIAIKPMGSGSSDEPAFKPGPYDDSEEYASAKERAKAWENREETMWKDSAGSDTSNVANSAEELMAKYKLHLRKNVDKPEIDNAVK